MFKSVSQIAANTWDVGCQACTIAKPPFADGISILNGGKLFFHQPSISPPPPLHLWLSTIHVKPAAQFNSWHHNVYFFLLKSSFFPWWICVSGILREDLSWKLFMWRSDLWLIENKGKTFLLHKDFWCIVCIANPGCIVRGLLQTLSWYGTQSEKSMNNSLCSSCHITNCYFHFAKLKFKVKVSKTKIDLDN